MKSPRRPALALIANGVVAAIGLVLTLALRFVSPARAPFAYLAAFVFALSAPLGALLFIMIAHTARARWFVVLRRTADAISATIPLFLLLFVPIALSLGSLYPWARPEGAIDPATRLALDARTVEWLAHQRIWNSPLFFIVRSYVYLIVWAALAELLRRASIASDADPRPLFVRRQRIVSAAGIPIMAVTLTLAAFDWIMPLNIGWYSDILGLYFFAGAFAGAMGLTLVAVYYVWRAGLFPNEVGASHFHALGRVLLVSVIFWTYMSLSQFLLMWIADLPQEISFYADRVRGGWAWVSGILVVAHFAIPFLLLLPRGLKRHPRPLAFIGAWLVVAHALDLYWLVVPARAAPPSLLDLPPFIGISALAIACGIWRFGSASPIPLRDPALGPSLRYESP